MSTGNELNPIDGSDTNSTASVSISPPRQWRDSPDGRNDKQVDIWYNGKWVPAYFSDIKTGDFYLILDVDLAPTLCFFAASDVRRYASSRSYLTGAQEGHPSFMIRNGSEIVQAPAIKDINTTALQHERKMLK